MLVLLLICIEMYWLLCSFCQGMLRPQWWCLGLGKEGVEPLDFFSSVHARLLRTIRCWSTGLFY